MNTLKRIFKVGAREIEAPLANGTLQQNVEQLMVNFPMFRFTHVLESDGVPQQDGSILYEVELPPCKTNG
ncbi:MULTISPECIES: hypothetical protein [unclassified Pseudoalteromonas]|jgi:hypothetical protein|uniref:hypothetical protein n=1 Tax=unclassified Pseudoalteromonas TaxID=194690 RepID=UPI002358DDE0|nr:MULTISPECIES: hypothetical protein [unclassified Pseudoalteromonas]MCP4058879.1 hypothetical protein [Pseudoalteromonas sp.]MDC9502977.1 hypothetical protein [Pseudoalteromonas sp. Angola-18]MDC9530243.1 hypothetical protein [Pseudoalteromonas sp. Angola-7]MDC9563439.1 hypothetical protein [Pseudoalteromonas sp. GAB2316C]MDC9572079.1 hypothetical protein [Pseudoalteromonas sp. GABNS16A]|tara:strand:+ start:203 stop:412 length:210 start_codon:yes stop_codon:yes gene_type:complete